MSYDGATFSQHSVLSPPLLAAIDSQHIFGSYDAPQPSQAPGQRRSVDAASASNDPSHTIQSHQRTRSRASSVASMYSAAAASNVASPSLQQNGHSNSHRRARRGPTRHDPAQTRHSRTNSRSGPVPTPSRSAASAVCSSAVSDEPSPLTSISRNRSTPQLEGLRHLSAVHQHNHASVPSAFTAPSSPLLSAAASMALAMSPVAQASAMADQLMPSELTLDTSVSTPPYTSLSRNASDYFDPALLAQLQAPNGSSHPELRPNGRSDASPPVDSVFGRVSPQPSPAARSVSPSEWVQHAAHMQQTAELLGLHRLFTSRSTPHLPDLDASFLRHDFESPPPYAPRASALETELERAGDLSASASTMGPRQESNLSNSSSTSTVLDASTTSNADPPLPPPISIPSNLGAHAAPGTALASIPTRPSLRARSSSRGSRSGPPSPSASFYGRRGLTSVSPFPAGLGMTPSITHVSQFSSTPTSPGFAPDSDRDDDLDDALSFSSSRSQQRRDERRQTASTDHAYRTDSTSGSAQVSLPESAAQALASLARRRRSGSAGSARQPLRPRTPMTREQATPHRYASNSGAQLPAEEVRALSPPPAAIDSTSALSSHSRDARSSVPVTTAPTTSQLRGPTAPEHNDPVSCVDGAGQPFSPTSDSTQPESPHSHDAVSDLSRSGGLPVQAHAVLDADAQITSPEKPTELGDQEDEEEFPMVLKLLLHPLRILAAVPGCIGTFWLARNAWMLATRHGHLLSPGQKLIAADATGRFSGAEALELSITGPMQLGRRQPGSLDFAVACLWSMSTAYHALSFTTLLLRRWLLYYSILPSLIRLVALQAICWPLVRLTVHVFGADQPLGAWVVIGTTTALSDVVSRWVTSNIADAPLDDELDEEEEEEVAGEDTLGYLPDARFIRNSTRPGVDEHPMHVDQSSYSRTSGPSLGADSDWDPRSGDESDAAAASVYASERERQRKQRRGGQGTRFWRAVIGGPSFAASSRRRRNNKASPAAPGAGTETEMEGESDWPGYATDRTVLGGTGVTTSRAGFSSSGDGLRRRGATTDPVVSGSSAGARTEESAGVPASATKANLERRTILPPFPLRTSSYKQGRARFVYRAGVWTRERTSSRRNFHWEVAVWRNVLPIAILSYLSMWILIFDAMRLGA